MDKKQSPMDDRRFELDQKLFILAGKIGKQSWIAFISTFVIGLLDYLYIITNKFLTYDSTWNMFSDQNMITSGRQFLKHACSISSYYDLPAVNGILALIYLSITAAILVRAFEIKSTLFSILTGGILVTFPTISSTFCYTYTVDGYMLSVLIITIAFVLMDKYRFGWIPAIILIGFSLGIYQAYYPYLIVICMLKLITSLIFESDIKPVFRKGLRYVIAGVGGYIFYAVTLKLMLHFTGASLSGYQGSDRVLGFNLSEVPVNCYKAARNFFSFVFSMNVLTTTKAMKLGLLILFLVAVVAFVYLFVVNRVYAKPLRWICILILLALLPTFSSLVMVMAPDAYLHVLMRLPWSVFFIYGLFLVEKAAERFEGSSRKICKKISLVTCLVFSLFMIIMIQQFMVMQGIVAFNMHERYEKTYYLCQSLIDRLDRTDEYQYGDPVAIIGGGLDPSRYPQTSITDQYVGWYFGVNGELCVNSTEQFEAFSSHYLGISFVCADNEAITKILETEEYKEMNVYPKEDCIQNINGVWTIKLVE